MPRLVYKISSELTSLIVRRDWPDWPEPAPEKDDRSAPSFILPAPPTENDLENACGNGRTDEPDAADADVFIMAAVAADESTGGVAVCGRPAAAAAEVFPAFPFGVEVVINRQLALAEDELRRGSDTKNSNSWLSQHFTYSPHSLYNLHVDGDNTFSKIYATAQNQT